MTKGSSICHQCIFWDTAMVHLTKQLVHNFKAIQQLLPTEEDCTMIWMQPISLLTPQESMFTFLSGASHKGLGGWSPQFNLMWQVTKEEHTTLGFIMAKNSEPGPDDPPNILHINVLEFMALLVNVWFALAMCTGNDPTHQRQHIRNCWSDNTLALSWMVHAGCAKKPHSCQLARFLQALFTLSPICFQFHSHHILGHSNKSADILSWPSCAKSWGSIIRHWPHDLFPCRPYLVPHRLLSKLLGCTASTGIEAMSIAKTITQSTPKLRILPPGWEQSAMTIRLCK